MNDAILGGLSANAFLRRHWQKRPLLVRAALPRFAGILDFADMIDAASREDCESRLVLRRGDRWAVEHGPFARQRFARLPARNWTLLVQGIDRILPAARELLSQFNFLPYSRLDDLMVSYAPAGGGVGAHFDSYDVFLLQGPGQRLWRVGRQPDLTLVEDAPLKVLKRFTPDGQCLLSAGDMLYLPPQFAHEGTAVDVCHTYSIGFRAPSHRELISQFLIYLEDRIAGDSRYGDPELRAQANPAQIGADMIAKVGRILSGISWTQGDVVEYLGRHLTEPKPQVTFAPPRRPLSQRDFLQAAARRGVELALASQMLYGGATFFINGDLHKTTGQDGALRRLADARRLPARRIPRGGRAADLLYQWYRAGYIGLSEPAPAGQLR